MFIFPFLCRLGPGSSGAAEARAGAATPAERPRRAALRRGRGDLGGAALLGGGGADAEGGRGGRSSGSCAKQGTLRLG